MPPNIAVRLLSSCLENPRSGFSAVSWGPMAVLSEEELAAALAELPGWQQERDAIRRVFEFASFRAAMKFVHRVADLAEARNHHPDIDVRYRQVVLRLSSHDVAGVTSRDIGLAREIDRR